MRGIDISEAQKNIDLSKIDFDFVIIKATEGKTYTDPCFFKHLNNALKIGKPIGFYHYARPENNSAHDEVDNFLKAVGDLIGQGIPFLDWESIAKYNVDWAKAWMDEFYSRTGVKPIIYMSVLSCEHAYNWSNVASKYNLWIACYRDHEIDYNYDMSHAGNAPKTYFWESYVMWQWTSKGRLDGYGSDLDCDEFYGDKSLWERLQKVEGDMEYNYIEVLDGVNVYSKRELGEYFFTIDGRVSNFQVKEFACHDGTNEILIDGTLVRTLQKCRDKYGVTTINSAYRTPEYNKSIGGATNSQHCKGKASDTVCKGATPLELAMYAEAIGLGGIGLYSSFTHIDTRDGKARWDSTSGKEVGVSTFFKTIRFGSVGQYVRICQKYLGFSNKDTDGIFGNKTLKAVKDFQYRKGLDVDGIVGAQTWTKLMTQ